MRNKKKERIHLTRTKHAEKLRKERIAMEIGLPSFDAERTRVALDDGVSPDTWNPKYRQTPVGMVWLRFAETVEDDDRCFADLLLKFKLLLEAGADLDYPTTYAYYLFRDGDDKGGFGKLPIVRRRAILQLMVRFGFDLDACNNDDPPLVYLMACREHIEFMAMLLEMKADPDVALNAPIGNHERPIHVASERGFENVVKLLIDARADLEVLVLRGEGEENYVTTALGFASEYGHERIAELLLMAGANVNAAAHIDAGKLAGRSYPSAFFLAAEYCHISTMRLLLKHRANPDQPRADGLTPLILAAQNVVATL